MENQQNIENLSDNDERIKEIEEIVKAEKIDPTTALNILINAIQVSFDSDYFNDLDKYLIAKSLNCFKDYVDAGENFLIKVKD